MAALPPYTNIPDTMDVTTRRGDSIHWGVQIQEDGANVDIRPWTVAASVRASAEATDTGEVAVFTVDSTTYGASGLAILTLPTAEAQKIGTGWVWDVQVTTDDSPPEVHTVLAGPWTANPDVTK